MKLGLIGAQRVSVCRLCPENQPSSGPSPSLCLGSWETGLANLPCGNGVGHRALGRGEARLSSGVERTARGLGTKWGVIFFTLSKHVETRGECVWRSQRLNGLHALSLDRVFVADLYKEGLALGWGLSLCKVKLSHTLSCLYFFALSMPVSCCHSLSCAQSTGTLPFLLSWLFDFFWCLQTTREPSLQWLCTHA